MYDHAYPVCCSISDFTTYVNTHYGYTREQSLKIGRIFNQWYLSGYLPANSTLKYKQSERRVKVKQLTAQIDRIIAQLKELGIEV